MLLIRKVGLTHRSRRRHIHLYSCRGASDNDQIEQSVRLAVLQVRPHIADEDFLARRQVID